MIISEALAKAQGLAESTGIPISDFYFLLSYITGLSSVQLRVSSAVPLDDTKQYQWEYYLRRILAGEPAQYITGNTFFYGYEFDVNPNCLIPRQETEGLVELAIDIVRRSVTCNSVLDIGTGSGAIAVTIKKLAPEVIVSATDICDKALEIAKNNAEKMNVLVEFYKADIWPKIDTKYDLIISNPPYISINAYNALPRHIKDWEPKTALLAEDKGLYFYNRILSTLVSYINPGAIVLLEIGSDQAMEVKDIAKNYSFTNLDILPDLSGRDRYVKIIT